MVLAAALVFLAAYTLNVLTITLGYHRGLAHGALTFHPRVRALLLAGGNWITGIDPKAWVVMHRMHHAYSDTPQDPHSPTNVGLLGIGIEQLRSYERTLRRLVRRDPAYTAFARDLDFDVSWLNRKKRWFLPYVLHAVVALALALAFTGGWLLGAAYFLGMMSHPVQGGLVNALGHAVGGRNFDTKDDSRNNHLVAWLVGGEGFQNNHHRYPSSARFSWRRTELDPGYLAARALEAIGLLTIDEAHLIPRAPTFRIDPAHHPRG